MTTTTDNDRKWQMLRYKIFERQIADAFIAFRAADIEPILIKGWAAAQVYPEPFTRSFSDIDLAVAPADYQAAEKLIAARNMAVDLHCGLRHLDVLDWAWLAADSQLKVVEGVPIRVLKLEDHLRVLCVHWLNDGGAYKEKLLDVYYGIASRPADFDWDRFLNAVGEIRRKWFINAVRLAHKYFIFKETNFPFDADAQKIPGWLVRAIENEWKSGTVLRPLADSLNDKKMLWRQIIKRIPPNAVQSMIESESDFDANWRFPSQMRGLLRRIVPSIQNLRRTITTKKN